MLAKRKSAIEIKEEEESETKVCELEFVSHNVDCAAR